MDLSGLAIGSLTLTPAFDADTTSYTATTTSATNTVTATPVATNDAVVTIEFNSHDYESGDSLTWDTGENTVDVVVTNHGQSKTYTVVVTKS